MAKNTTTSDNEIDLIELIQVFITHKAKFIILSIVGLSLGLVYTFQNELRYETNFKVTVGNPAFSNSFLIDSAAMQEILNISELNKKTIPNYSFDKKTKLFSVITATDDVSQRVTDLLTEAMRQELDILKKIAGSFEGFDKNQVMLNNNNNNNNNLTWTNQDIAKLNTEQIAQSVKVSFSEAKVLSPNPRKYGVIGIFIGLILAFLWMMAVILVRQLKKK